MKLSTQPDNMYLFRFALNFSHRNSSLKIALHLHKLRLTPLKILALVVFQIAHTERIIIISMKKGSSKCSLRRFKLSK
jgi:hypothetical protein